MSRPTGAEPNADDGGKGAGAGGGNCRGQGGGDLAAAMREPSASRVLMRSCGEGEASSRTRARAVSMWYCWSGAVD